MKRDNVAYVRRELTRLIKGEVRRLRGLNRERDDDGTLRWLERTAVFVAESEVRLNYLIGLSGLLHDHGQTIQDIIRILAGRRQQLIDAIRVERLWKVEGGPGLMLVRQARCSAYMDLMDYTTGPLGRLFNIAVNLSEGRKPDEGKVRPDPAANSLKLVREIRDAVLTEGKPVGFVAPKSEKVRTVCGLKPLDIVDDRPGRKR